MVLLLADPIPPDETDRLAAIDRPAFVGLPSASDFDAILALVLDLTGCAAGEIGLIDADRRWFKAEPGMGLAASSRPLSWVADTLLAMTPLVVEDMTRDTRFCGDPDLVASGFRFYAGVALAGEGGSKVGVLCVADPESRKATPQLTKTLVHLGRIAERLLETYARAAKALSFARNADDREREIGTKTRMLEQSERMAKIGAWELDVATGIFSLSNEAYRLHEIALATVLHIDTMHALFPLSDLNLVAARYRKAIATGEGYEIVGDVVTARGTRRWTHHIVQTEKKAGKVVRVFGAIRDMTEEHEAEQALWRAAHYDTLTKAPNRHYWTTRLDEAFARAEAETAPLTILMFDLDGFKEINDTRGHAAGDTVLREVAVRLQDTLPKGAFHARLGGDEFAVLLEGPLPASDLDDTVRALLVAIQRPIIVGALRLQTSGTFGSASFPADASTASDLMQKADIALYQAKRSNRSSFVSFRSEIGDLFNNKRHAIDLVTAAIDQNRLAPFYQPKVDLRTGRPVGFEALCRIEAADGTILGPSQFLPALQEVSTAARIGAVMLDLVTADIAAWITEGLEPGRVALNVTSADFAKDDLAPRVLSRLAALELPTSVLEIEVTENIILGKEAEVVGEALQAMRDKGIVIALDDFGTGYASLTHLRDAPIQYLKLDRSFISGLGRGPESAIIVRSIVDLGHSLGMHIVAEGVETQGHADFLRAIGCDKAQGFLYGRPGSASATRKSLEEQRRQRDASRLRDPLQAGYFNFLSRR